MVYNKEVYYKEEVDGQACYKKYIPKNTGNGNGKTNENDINKELLERRVEYSEDYLNTKKEQHYYYKAFIMLFTIILLYLLYLNGFTNQ